MCIRDRRIRLATQIGSSLVGVLYILDEPSIGLHPVSYTHLVDWYMNNKQWWEDIINGEYQNYYEKIYSNI